MKKITLTLCAFLFTGMAWSQNSYPSTGNIPLGVDTAKAKVDIGIAGYQSDEGGVRITIPNQSSMRPSSNNDLVFQIREDEGSGIWSNHFLVEDDGQVGIGVRPADGVKLHVYGGILRLEGNTVAGGPMMAIGGTSASAPNGEWGIEYNTSGTESGLNFWKPYGSNNYGNYYMFLADNGKVSIGLDPNDPDTYNGNYRLYVADGIMTERIKVAIHASTDWADYVFASDYALMPLEEVDTFIEQNGHLPNVPSADEVAESGIDVAAMDAKLLEKIEELTLYMIELKQENEEMKQELNELKK